MTIERIHLVRQADGTIEIEVYDLGEHGAIIRRQPASVRDPLADRFDNYREAGAIAGTIPQEIPPCRARK